MTNQENMRGNPNPNSNTPAPAPSSSASTSNTPSAKPPSTSAPSAPSLASRIQTSATGLAKSAFQPSPDLANTLASTTSSKPAGPSSLPNTQTSRDLPTNTTPHGAPGPGSASGSAYAAQSFREHDTSTSTPGGFALPALTEDEFQGNTYGHGYVGLVADNTEADQLRATTNTTTTNTNTNQSQSQFQSQDLQTPSSTWKGKARAQDPTQHQFETDWQRQWHDQQSPQTTDTQTTDGAAVVSLLSDITFDPNFEDPTTVPDTEIDIAAAPAPLSGAEREMLDSFRRGLGLDVEDRNMEREGRGNVRLTGASLIPDIDVFLSQGIGAEGGIGIGGGIGTGIGEGNAMPMATGSGSGFIPTSIRDAVLRNIPGGDQWVGAQETDIDVFLSQGVGAGSGSGIRIGEGNAMPTGAGFTSTSTSTSLRDSVLANLPGAGDWIGVQERYHDEVWGFLQPVLEEAKAEIEEKGVEGLGHGEDGPAVRRLKMILMHMKG